MRTLIALLIGLSFLLPASLQAAQGPWVKIREKNGVSLYKREVSGSPINEFKGEIVIDACITVVEAVLRDVPAYAQFMSRCIEGKLIKAFSKDEMVILNVTHTPWPLNDREVVVRSYVYRDYERGIFTVLLKGLDEPESSQYCPQRRDRVRMHDLAGIFTLEVLDREQTRVSFIVHADPVGVPPVLTNLFTDDNPYETLQGLKRMVLKEKYIAEGRRSTELGRLDEFLSNRRKS